MRLIITRHGETEENRAGIIQGQLPGKLTRRGINQAKKLALYLKGETIDYIYSSDLKRAVDTTKEILRYIPGTPVTYKSILRERNFGELQGISKRKLYKISNGDLTSLINKHGESDKDVYLRAMSFFNSLKEQNLQNKTILVVCHGRFGKLLIAVIRGIDYSEAENMKNLYNTSVSIFNVSRNNISMECFNIINHLKKGKD